MFDYIDIVFIICMALAVFGSIAQLCVHFYNKGYISGQKLTKSSRNKNKKKRSYK